MIVQNNIQKNKVLNERLESVETYFRTCEDCAYYDTDKGDMPCCGCVDKINFEPMEVTE